MVLAHILSSSLFYGAAVTAYLFVAAILGDLVILDWLIVSRITPGFVIIPGTGKEDYSDFSNHFRAHASAAVVLLLLALILASVLSYI